MHPSRIIVLQFALLFLLFCLTACNPPAAPIKTFRLSTMSDPDSLDPRLARSLQAATAINLLFEGLMRIDAGGVLQPAAASAFEVSSDGLTYTFTIRDNLWSNGDPVTAEDFVYSWQNQLNRTVPAPNAHNLFIIQSIEAKDAHTLVVNLKQPNVYFLEMLAYYPFFPINSRAAKEHPDWADGALQFFTSNGPFRLATYKSQNELIAIKNPTYWNQKAVQLNQINLLTLDEHTALSLYATGDLDWLGSPLSNLPPDAVATLKTTGQLNQAQAAGTHWVRVNTRHAPLNDPRIRRALALSIDRQSLAEHLLQDGQKPATAIIPPGNSWTAAHHFKDHDIVEAKALLAEALQGSLLPPLTFIYGYSERHHKIAQALQAQWREALGIEVSLEALESKTFFDRLRSDQYQLANGSWFADFRDPSNFLAVFKNQDNGTNNTGWENAVYRQLVEQASQEANLDQRHTLLLKAESLLMSEMPVIPIFFYTFSYLKNPKITGVGLSELGILNLDNADIQSP